VRSLDHIARDGGLPGERAETALIRIADQEDGSVKVLAIKAIGRRSLSESRWRALRQSDWERFFGAGILCLASSSGLEGVLLPLLYDHRRRSPARWFFGGFFNGTVMSRP